MKSYKSLRGVTQSSKSWDGSDPSGRQFYQKELGCGWSGEELLSDGPQSSSDSALPLIWDGPQIQPAQSCHKSETPWVTHDSLPISTHVQSLTTSSVHMAAFLLMLLRFPLSCPFVAVPSPIQISAMFSCIRDHPLPICLPPSQTDRFQQRPSSSLIKRWWCLLSSSFLENCIPHPCTCAHSYPPSAHSYAVCTQHSAPSLLTRERIRGSTGQVLTFCSLLTWPHWWLSFSGFLNKSTKEKTSR